MTQDEYRNRGGRSDHRNAPRNGRDRDSDRGYGHRDGNRGYGNGPRDRSDRREGPRDRRYSRPRNDRRDRHNTYTDKPRIAIPADVTAILHKGVDCEIKKMNDEAMVLYLNGASKMNGGCEKNLIRMLKDAGTEQFPAIRERLGKECPKYMMAMFDYLCSTIDPGYDTSFIKESAGIGNIVAISCLIRMSAVDKDSELIDVFAKEIGTKTDIVTAGLKDLVRKTKSTKAEKYLTDYQDQLKQKNSIPQVFTKAMNGYGSAKSELSKLANRYPEAKFFSGYVQAFQKEEAEVYVRKQMKEYEPLILSSFNELRLPRTPYSTFLKAKKIKSENGPWVSLMVESMRQGCDEALDELDQMQCTREVRRSLEAYYLSKGDIDRLLDCYDGKNSEYLDKYCNNDVGKILEIGKRLGGPDELNWLRNHCLDGIPECKDALIEIAKDKRRHNKALLYALHDSGADIEAADVYFGMAGSPDAPSVKWLQKVCRNEEAKEYVRSKFEEMGDLATFDYIFEDDGYIPGNQYKKEKKRSEKRRY
ncbi:MAG: hypothetical protein MJZ68_01050 [archaeon]|nr:hypothetical protein [archaeon]